MEQIEQLKAMRDAAKSRIEALPDFRLMTSLTALIDDLESALGLNTPVVAAPSPDDVEQSAPAIVAVTAILPEMEQAVETPAPEEQVIGTVEPEEMSGVEGTLQAEVVPAPSVPAPDIEAPAVVEPEIIETEVLVLGAEELPADATFADALGTNAEALEVLEAVEEALSAEDFALREADARVEPANDLSTVFAENAGLSESEEEAVNRALAELSVDLDEDTGFEPAQRPSILRR